MHPAVPQQEYKSATPKICKCMQVHVKLPMGITTRAYSGRILLGEVETAKSTSAKNQDPLVLPRGQVHCKVPCNDAIE